MVDNTFGGVQPKGYTMISHLAKDSNNIDEDEIKIFDQLIRSSSKPRKSKRLVFNKPSLLVIIQQTQTEYH